MIAENPKEMAAMLIEENGLDSAHHLAVAEITRANENCDYYTLSVWREIRGVIRDQIELAEEVTANEPYL
jgi:hypothetical protein